MAYGLGAFRTDIFSPALGKVGQGISTGMERGQKLDYLKMLQGKKDDIESQPMSYDKQAELEKIEKQIAKIENEISSLKDGETPSSLTMTGDL